MCMYVYIVRMSVGSMYVHSVSVRKFGRKWLVFSDTHAHMYCIYNMLECSECVAWKACPVHFGVWKPQPVRGERKPSFPCLNSLC